MLNEYIKPIIYDGLDVQGLENLNAYLYGDEMAALQNYPPVGRLIVPDMPAAII